MLLLEQVAQLLPEGLGIGQRGVQGGPAVHRLPKGHGNHLVLHHEGRDLLLADEINHLGIGHLVYLGAEHAAEEGKEQNQPQQIDNHGDKSTVSQWVSP